MEEKHLVRLNIHPGQFHQKKTLFSLYIVEGHRSGVTPSQSQLATTWRTDIFSPTKKSTLGVWPEGRKDSVREGGHGICPKGVEVTGKRVFTEGFWGRRTSLRAPHGAEREDSFWGSFE